MVRVLEIATITSCNDVAIKKVKIMLTTPTHFSTNAVCFWGIFRDVEIKKSPLPNALKPMPMSAQILAGFGAPLSACAKNRLLKKFFVQSNPTEFLFRMEPPGYSKVAITRKSTEITSHIRTEYFRISWSSISPVFVATSGSYNY